MGGATTNDFECYLPRLQELASEIVEVLLEESGRYRRIAEDLINKG